MNHHRKHKMLSRKKWLLTTLPLVLAAHTQAFEFDMGGIEGVLDSQVSMGSSWRLEEQDADLLSETKASNENGGNLNFSKGDAFSQVIKGSHDLEVNYQNYGAFVRGKYWYDAALKDNSALDDSHNDDLAKFSGAQILDAFVYGEFDVLDMPLDLRLGKQVVTWGESNFIFGGANQINPIDMAAFNRPGAKIKEGLIPVNMAFASLGLNDDLSAEVFYQLEYKEFVLDGCGTYFSTNDYAGAGCDSVDLGDGAFIERAKESERRPNKDGQFGLALRFFSEDLDTEFGFYAMNVHSRLPIISTTKAVFDESAVVTAVDAMVPAGDSHDEDTIGTIGFMGTSLGDYTSTYGEANLVNPLVSSKFYIDYPVDQKIAAFTFSTTLAGMAVSGELSHQFDMPLQLNATTYLNALLLSDATYAYVFNAYGGEANAQQADTEAKKSVEEFFGSLGLDVLTTADGGDIAGHKEFDVSQAQVTVIKTFDQVLGASSYFLMAEAGYTYVHGLNNSDNIFGGGSVNDAYEGAVTQESWGYRGVIGGTYGNVFPGVSLSPELYFSHDVNGYSPSPTGNFFEGQKRIGLTLSADIRDIYSAAISYTQYFGGINDYLTDRDYASINVGMYF